MKHTIADNSSLSRFVRSVRRLPGDVVAAVGFVLVADATLLSLPATETTLRTVLGLPLLLFVPGYGLVSALFPGRQADTEWRSAAGPARDRPGITLGERAALSVGVSLALLLPLALVLSLVGRGFEPPTVVSVVSVVSLVGLLVATVRRWQLPETERFRVPVRDWVDDLHAATLGADSTFDAALNVALVAAVVLAATGVTYAVVAPPRGQPHTDFSLLTENESGDLVASGYPTELVQGEGQPLTVSIENHEREQTGYTVVVELQRVRTDGTSVTVLERQDVTRLQATVDAGDTWQRRHTVTPRLQGSNLRLTYYFYHGDAPAEPDAASADQTLFTWVNVTEQ